MKPFLVTTAFALVFFGTPVGSPDIRTPLRAAQIYLSPKCATPKGVCLVAPQPVGSPCFCGPDRGQIIP